MTQLVIQRLQAKGGTGGAALLLFGVVGTMSYAKMARTMEEDPPSAEKNRSGGAQRNERRPCLQVPNTPTTTTTTTLCETSHKQSIKKEVGAPAPSWWRQKLHVWHVKNLPPPPRRLAPHDPVWTLTNAQKKQRSNDELKQQQILQEIQKASAESSSSQSNEELKTRLQKVGAWQKQWLDTVYGPGVTLKDRQNFLERYGCTGWTEEVLMELLDLGQQQHGIVEIGAGNGQWARVLTDRYNNQQQGNKNRNPKGFDFVLAYDDGSQLPLNPKVYHSKTQPVHDYFYKNVQALHANSVGATVKQWTCRGRVLLLVYPPPESDMAMAAVRAYDDQVQLGEQKTGAVVVYIGEGRGGANATDEFFDYFENADNGWILDKVLNVKSFGTKGYEKMYVFKKEAAYLLDDE